MHLREGWARTFAYLAILFGGLVSVSFPPGSVSEVASNWQRIAFSAYLIVGAAGALLGGILNRRGLQYVGLTLIAIGVAVYSIAVAFFGGIAAAIPGGFGLALVLLLIDRIRALRAVTRVLRQGGNDDTR